MARIILTGSHEAIDLKRLSSDDVLKLDNVADDICRRNGGYAELVIDMIQGLFIKLHVKENYVFRKMTAHKEED